MIKNSTAMQEPWVLACIRKIPCRKKWLSTPVFLCGEFRDSRAWCVRSMGWQRVEYDSMTKHTHVYKYVCVSCIYSGCCTLQLEKAMATHSSTLAWKIPWTEEPGGLQSMGFLRVGHD